MLVGVFLLVGRIASFEDLPKEGSITKLQTDKDAVLRGVVTTSNRCACPCGTKEVYLREYSHHKVHLLGNLTGMQIEHKMGGCVIKVPTGAVPTDPYVVSRPQNDKQFPPFDKHMNVYGLRLLGSGGVSDSQMCYVANAFKSMFPTDVEDPAKQKELLVNMYKYQAAIPLFPDNKSSKLWSNLFKRRPSSEQRPMYHAFRDQVSLCDCLHVSAEPELQVLEVLEHLLHEVTDVGLPYTFPDQWGFSKTSAVWKIVKLAAKRRILGARAFMTDARRMRQNSETLRRTMIQEFSYWVITTIWELQHDHEEESDVDEQGTSRGHEGEKEWAVTTGAELREKLPEIVELCEATIFKLMRKPGREIIEALHVEVSDQRQVPSHSSKICSMAYDDKDYQVRPFFDCCC